MGATNRLTTTSARSAERDLVITRVFDAPRELVFRAWTECQRGWAESLDRLAGCLAKD